MEYKQPSEPKARKSRRVPVTFLVDILLTGACLVVFALFDHVLPRARMSVPISTPAPLSASIEGSPDGDFSDRFPDKFTSGEVIATPNSYQSANVNVTLTRYEMTYDDRPVVYFVEDIYIRSIECMRTLFAQDAYGQSITESVLSMSQRSNAIAAINTDFFGFRDTGVVIRNGVLYRDTFPVEENLGVLILYRDGTMRAFNTAQELDIEQIVADGAWQGFSFGPPLLDGQGNIPESFRHSSHNPRTVLGMVEPGHYMFIVFDGRQEGYSMGMNLDGLADISQQLGCVMAYNLDGGKTTNMTFMGETASQPYKGGRDTSDILYIADIDIQGEADS